MFKSTRNIFSKALIAGVLLASFSCDEESGSDNKPDDSSDRLFTIAFADGSGSPSATYVQSHSDLSAETNITFKGFGFEVPSTRTARLFTSSDGNTMYSLDYGGGSIYKFENNGGQDYLQVDKTNIEFAMGTAYPRWTRLNDDNAMLHSIATEQVFDETSGDYVYTKAMARLLLVDLEDLGMSTNVEFEIPRSVADEATGDFVFRIDAPVVSGDKIYYGMGKRGVDPANPDERADAAYNTVETLVLDFPSLENPTILSTDMAGGATNGYRTTVAYSDEKDDVYQIITVPDNTKDTYILKITNGTYDESFDFNLSEKLGVNTISNGWFYVGDGIGYVPYANSDLGGTGDAVWSVARVDLYNGSAVKLNTPENLWLQQYQNSVAVDDKFYMALAPLAEEGFIYEFDISSESADALTPAAAIVSAADSYYIGIY
ncbi:hypothetical protein KO507_03120 [Gilvimarinus agarilyticus]|uniref:hypothetical protein n=1 Tax=Reichenbachiella agariperforans TaxID=156994 RepID=UPI001C09AA90|nr:hypothetical protein [Reichenbachiella agariperforans]MBU2884752.1 hypothetical protein [Gilvimarinus agarilyticus]MBU2914926.1 hypothetical protein [Reichenbachiella agariperforans]